MSKDVLIRKAWIARDDGFEGEDGDLCLFCNKPKKTTIGGLGCWLDMYHEPEYLDSKLFPQIKWEDEEPTEVEVLVRLC